MKESEHYCYICVKKADAAKTYRLNWKQARLRILEEQSEDEEEYESNDEEEKDEFEDKTFLDDTIAKISIPKLGASDLELEILEKSLELMRWRLTREVAGGSDP